jgi:Mn2+/Fe2+ NRAMP family transporter
MEEESMDEGFGYIIAKALSSIFKNHPTLSFALFALIVIAILGGLLLNAGELAEVEFLVFGLIFVLVVGIGYFLRVSRQRSQENQDVEEVPRE